MLPVMLLQVTLLTSVPRSTSPSDVQLVAPQLPRVSSGASGGLVLSTGTSASHPQATAIANCSVSFAPSRLSSSSSSSISADAPAVNWVRIDRLDGLDQSFDNFPVWVKREWGFDTIAFQFSGMKGDNPGNWGPLLSVGHVEIVASG
jgi:hypothetical protein